MEIRNIKTFIRAAETGNFTKTAEELGYSQGTVTLQIKQLEAELGVPLFNRTGKRIRLSEKGREFMDYACSIVRTEAEARSAMEGKTEIKGTLAVGMLESVASFYYREIIKQFVTIYPEAKLIVKIATTVELMDMLKKGMLDVIVIYDRQIQNDNWKCPVKAREPLKFFAGHQSSLSEKHVCLRELGRENFILTEKGCTYRKVIDDFTAARNIELNWNIDIGNTGAIIDFVSRGMGISLLPEYCIAEYLERGDICEIYVDDFEAELYLQVIYDGRKWMSPVKNAFVELCSNKQKNIIR